MSKETGPGEIYILDDVGEICSLISCFIDKVTFSLFTFYCADFRDINEMRADRSSQWPEIKSWDFSHKWQSNVKGILHFFYTVSAEICAVE